MRRTPGAGGSGGGDEELGVADVGRRGSPMPVSVAGKARPGGGSATHRGSPTHVRGSGARHPPPVRTVSDGASALPPPGPRAPRRRRSPGPRPTRARPPRRRDQPRELRHGRGRAVPPRVLPELRRVARPGPPPRLVRVDVVLVGDAPDGRGPRQPREAPRRPARELRGAHGPHPGPPRPSAQFRGHLPPPDRLPRRVRQHPRRRRLAVRDRHPPPGPRAEPRGHARRGRPRRDAPDGRPGGRRRRVARPRRGLPPLRRHRGMLRLRPRPPRPRPREVRRDRRRRVRGRHRNHHAHARRGREGREPRARRVGELRGGDVGAALGGLRVRRASRRPPRDAIDAPVGARTRRGGRDAHHARVLCGVRHDRPRRVLILQGRHRGERPEEPRRHVPGRRGKQGAQVRLCARHPRLRAHHPAPAPEVRQGRVRRLRGVRTKKRPGWR